MSGWRLLESHECGPTPNPHSKDCTHEAAESRSARAISGTRRAGFAPAAAAGVTVTMGLFGNRSGSGRELPDGREQYLPKVFNKPICSCGLLLNGVQLANVTTKHV